jgi:hypothetical protein
MISRREFLVEAGIGMTITAAGGLAGCANSQPLGGSATEPPFFITRGAVLVAEDMKTYDWQRRWD